MLLAACAVLLGARTSEAHVLDAVVATPDCGTNTIGLHLTGSLMQNGLFSVPYTITFTCSDGGPAIAPISNTATDTVTNASTPGSNDGTFDIAVMAAAPLAGRTCTVSGTATLFQFGTQYNTVAMTDAGGATQIPVACGPSTTTTTTTTTSTTITTVPYQCYEVDDAVFAAQGLSLVDRYGSSTVNILRPKRLCNPADENHQNPGAISQPDHLVGYDIQQMSPPFSLIRNQQVTTQFGTVTVLVARPKELLVPSAKSLVGPPPPLGTPVVDHFKCYIVKGAKQRVSGVEVEDEFGSLTEDLKKPYRLCVGVDVNGGGVLDPTAALLCYKLHLAQGTPPFFGPPGPVFVNDEFQATEYTVHHEREFCVPATVN
jgi:hypothetical protein